MKERKKKARYVDDGHTVYDMSGLTDSPKKQAERKDSVSLSRKEKRAAIRAAFSVYLPALLTVLIGFGAAALLIFLWLH